MNDIPRSDPLKKRKQATISSVLPARGVRGQKLTESGEQHNIDSTIHTSALLVTASGLGIDYEAGRVFFGGTDVISIVAGHISLPPNSTLYVYVEQPGIVSSSTTGFSSNVIPLALVVTGATSVTSVTDKRAFFILAGSGGGGGAHAASHSEGGSDDLVAQNVNVQRLKIEDTDATPTEEVILKVIDRKLWIRNLTDVTYRDIVLDELYIGGMTTFTNLLRAVGGILYVRLGDDSGLGVLLADQLIAAARIVASEIAPYSGDRVALGASADRFGLPQIAGDPATVVDADTWYNTTTGKLRAREGGVSKDVIGGGGGGHTIRDEGGDLASRTGLNFRGGLVAAVDDAVGNESEVRVGMQPDQTNLFATADAAPHLTIGAAGKVIALLDTLRFGTAGVAHLQDSGGNERARLATASPHITLTGDIRVNSGQISIGEAPSGNRGMNVAPAIGTATSLVEVLRIQPAVVTIGANAVDYNAITGIPLVNFGAAGITGTRVYGLNFITGATGGGGATTTVTSMIGCDVDTLLQAANAAITDLIVIRAGAPSIQSPGAGMSIATTYGLYIDSVGISNKQVDAISLRIVDQGAQPTGAQYLIEAGPATPYLRLLGAVAPAANQTNLYLSEGGTLRQVQWKLFSALVAGDRVMVLV